MIFCPMVIFLHFLWTNYWCHLSVTKHLFGIHFNEFSSGKISFGIVFFENVGLKSRKCFEFSCKIFYYVDIRLKVSLRKNEFWFNGRRIWPKLGCRLKPLNRKNYTTQTLLHYYISNCFLIQICVHYLFYFKLPSQRDIWPYYL